MRRLEYGKAFKKDYKRMAKRGASMAKLEAVLELLMSDVPLPARNRPHMLSGEWKGFSECHIEPDWLLIYDLADPEVVALHRTGTHSDLFEWAARRRSGPVNSPLMLRRFAQGEASKHAPHSRSSESPPTEHPSRLAPLAPPA